MAKRDIVVIGGSTGSSAVLRTLLSDLPRDLPASLFITTHVPSAAPSNLARVLQKAASFPVVPAVHGQMIEPGRAYVAAPDRHLLLIDSTIYLGMGPRENMVRPAVDPMFRSAALAYGPRAVGVVLTGLLNDGASGLHAIARAGGTTVVQHPLDAEADDMPRAALETVHADYVARGDELAGLIGDIVRMDASTPGSAASAELIFEVDVAAGAPLGSAALHQVATPVPLTCPDCHGVLSEVKGSGPLRYRCQIGHAYSAEVLASQNEQVEEAIRVAMRVMEERVELVERMARDAREAGRNAVAELYEQRAQEYSAHARTLREAALINLAVRSPIA